MSALHHYNTAGHVMITNYALNSISTMEAFQHIHLSQMSKQLKTIVIKSLKRGVDVQTNGKAGKIIALLAKKHGARLCCLAEDGSSGYLQYASDDLKDHIEAMVGLAGRHARVWRHNTNISWAGLPCNTVIYEKALEEGLINPDDPALARMIEDVEQGITLSIKTKSDY